MTRVLPSGLDTRKESKRFAKFLVVGAAGFAVDFTVFNLAHALGVGTWVAAHLVPAGVVQAFLAGHPEVIEQTISISVAILNNFLWNWLWLYPEARGANQTHKMVKFVVVSLAGLLIGIPVFSVALILARELVAALRLENVGLNVAGNLAFITRVGVLLFWNFFVNRFWTYHDVV